MGIFDERKSLKPLEYKGLDKFCDAITHSFWHVDHFNYERDVKDFKTILTKEEQEVVKRSMLAISVVENKVKTFWARIDQRLPKPEIADVGHIFAGNEVIHKNTYSKLLTLLELDAEFETILDAPCMAGRVKYLKKYLEGVTSRSNKEFTKSLILFTLLVENAALFSQFFIMSSFSKYKNILKNFSNVINATAREEALHGKFGSTLINYIRQENPEWFDEEMESKILNSINKAYQAEVDVLDWIFEKGEIEHITKDEVKEYLKTRFNNSLEQIGYKKLFEVNNELLKRSSYMDVMLLSTKDFDFFDGNSTDYNDSQSFNEDLLWS